MAPAAAQYSDRMPATAGSIHWWELPRNEIAHNLVLWASYLPLRPSRPVLQTLPEDSCIGRVVRSGLRWEGWLTPYLDRFCDPTQVSIDIGANIGTHTVTMAERSGHVIALEPQARVFQALGSNLAPYANVTLINAGASDHVGTANLDDRADGNVGMAAITPGGEGEEIRLVRIDDLDLPGRVAFMKIDAELHEREVLAGAQATIARDQPIVIIEDQTDARSTLIDQGYSCRRISLHDFACLPDTR